MSIYDKLDIGIQRDMGAVDTSRYQSGDPSQPVFEKGLSNDRLRELLSELICSSQNLNVRIWLDGVYTDIDNAQVRDWMRGREVYFKVEGRVDGMKTPPQPSRETGD